MPYRYLVVVELQVLAWDNTLNTFVKQTASIIFSLVDSLNFQYHRTIAFDALLGGAEDVLRDLGVRQALRAMPKDARL
jgi:hypothetical protein